MIITIFIILITVILSSFIVYTFVKKHKKKSVDNPVKVENDFRTSMKNNKQQNDNLFDIDTYIE